MISMPPAPEAGAPIPRPPFHQVACVQLIVLMPVVIGLALQDVGLAIAVVLGGLTGVLPQAWFAWYAFRGKGRQGRVTERLIQGEATKIGLAALMCAAAFRCIPELQAVPFFVALITMMALGWWITARVLTAKV